MSDALEQTTISTLYGKEDMSLFEWVSMVTGYNVIDYSRYV